MEMNDPSSVTSSSSSPLILNMERPIWNNTLGPSRKNTSSTRKAKTRGIELIYKDKNHESETTDRLTSDLTRWSHRTGIVFSTRASKTFWSSKVPYMSFE